MYVYMFIIVHVCVHVCVSFQESGIDKVKKKHYGFWQRETLTCIVEHVLHVFIHIVYVLVHCQFSFCCSYGRQVIY